MAAKRNPAAELAKMRAESLSPERRAEIASEGGVASAKSLTKEERRARSKKGAAARWGKKKADK